MASWNLRLILVLPLALAASACSFAADDDDDDDTVVTTPDDDDSVPTTDDDDDDSTEPECEDADCPGGQICKAYTCADPVLPVLTPAALDTVTSEDTEANILINGRLIRPAAPTLLLGTLSSNMELSPDGQMLVVNENGFGTAINPPDMEDMPYGPYEDEFKTSKRHALRVLGGNPLEVRQVIEAPNGSLYYGLRFNAAGDRLYASGGEDQKVHRYIVSEDHLLTFDTSFDLTPCYTTDIVLNTTEDRMYVSCVLQAKIKVVEVGTAAVVAEWDTGTRPNTILLAGNRLVISNWTTENRPTGDTLTILDATTGALVNSVRVGLAPEGLMLSKDGTKAYSVGSNSDDVWELTLATGAARRLVSLHSGPSPEAAIKGIQPIGGVLSPDGATMYVAAAYDNCVEVIDVATGSVKGRIPAEWYANDVAISPDGQTLYVLNAKGRGDGPTDDGESVGRQLIGTLMTVTVPDEDMLEQWTATVSENNHRQQSYFDLSAGNDSALPSPGTGPSTKIKYVFNIFKENMTYDAVFGDAGIGRGHPEFTLWSEQVAPNHRKLAREFTVLDAFYTDGESSIAGHQWAMAGVEPDFMYRGWTLSYGGYGFPEYVYGVEPGSMPESEFFMPHLINAGVTVRAYGGIEHFISNAAQYVDQLVPGYNFNLSSGTKDRTRAEIFVREFDEMVVEGTVRRYNNIFLPNDHTFGIGIGRETPPSWVADNDEALGMVVDRIAHSPIWAESLIVVFEDDSQYGYDHIDKHRSPCLLIGPWVKRGHVSSVTYSMPNIHKTIELVFGVGPMTRFDETASGMYDAFVAKPDLTPYERVERQFPVEIYDGTQHDPLVKMSAKLNWDELDQAEGADELLWRYMKGTEPPKKQ